MSTRTITGNLATDPEVVQAGSIHITKLRVHREHGGYRGGKFVAHDTPTSHFVEARFELGESAAGSLHKGDAEIVVGKEHSNRDDRGLARFVDSMARRAAVAWWHPSWKSWVPRS